MKLFLTLIHLSFSFYSLACLTTAPKSINMVSEYDKTGVYFYNTEKVLNQAPIIKTRECRKTAYANHFFMVAFALRNQILSDNFSEYSLNELTTIQGDMCWLKRSPFKPMAKPERSKRLFERRRLLNTCLRVQVSDKSKQGIKFVDGTKKCLSRKINNNTVEIQGAYCFFKPYRDSDYKISLHINPECHNPKFLAENKIQPQDIFSVINTYVSSNASDQISNLTALSSSDFRLSLNPADNTIDKSEDYGRNAPLWPTAWEGMDVEIGALKISGRNSHTDMFHTPFVVNTRCPSKCNSEGVCTSACNYATPIIGEVSLFKKTDNGFEFISNWYDGSIALPQWQGIMKGMGHEITKGMLQTGELYKLEVNFKEPGIAFQKFAGKVFQKIKLKKEKLGSIDRDAGVIGTTPNITLLRNIKQLPTLPEVNSLSFRVGKLQESYDSSVQTLANYLNNRFWPPFYKKVCSGESGKCLRENEGFIKYQILFKLGEKKKNGEYEITQSFIKKSSNLATTYKAKKHTPAQLRCKTDKRIFDEKEDEEDEDLGFD